MSRVLFRRRARIFLLALCTLAACVWIHFFRALLDVDSKALRNGGAHPLLAGTSLPPVKTNFTGFNYECRTPEAIVDGVPWPDCKKSFVTLAALRERENCDVDRPAVATCSLLYHLLSVQGQCPQPRGNMFTMKSHSIKGNLATAKINDFLGLHKLLKGVTDYDWIKSRIENMEQLWLSAAKSVTSDGKLAVSRKKIQVHLGLMKYGFGKSAFGGGALGELVQWSDVIAALYVTGHEVVLTRLKTDLVKTYKDFNERRLEPCDSYENNVRSNFPFYLVYTDIHGYRDIADILRDEKLQSVKCRFRIVDSFGTEADFNDEEYRASKGREKSEFSGLNLDLRQFNTMFPHTPDNTFLGFVIEKPSALSQEAHFEQPSRNIALLYGKLEKYAAGKERFIDIIREYIPEVHATMKTAKQLPAYVTNHGVLGHVELFKLLQRTKLLVGLGHPFEGSGPLEAITMGAVFLNPKFAEPVGYTAKPTDRKVTSQNIYAEKFIGKPHVYTVDVDNETEVRFVLQEIVNSPEPGEHLPYEYSTKGMIERIATQVEKQDFCSKTPYVLKKSDSAQAQPWPPLRALTITSTAEGTSENCNDACEKLGKICEPGFFPFLNKESTIEEALSVKCRHTSISENTELDYPAYDPSSQICHLQTNPRLFSCAGNYVRMRRLCPCREFMRGQIALCPDCL